MPDIVTLVLTGGRAGTTCVLGKYQFVDGKAQVPMVGGLLRYMARIFAAFPEGSAALEAHNGESGVETGPRDGQADQVPSSVQPDEHAGEDPTVLTESTEGGDDTTEHSAEGDGGKQARIREALILLDKDNDDHWTQGGKPGIHVVSEILGEPVSRAEVDAAAAGFLREGEK